MILGEKMTESKNGGKLIWRVFAPQKIDSKSTFHRLLSNQNTTIHSACALGERLCYQRHDQHVLSELKWA
jgi:hypothetical protein